MAQFFKKVKQPLIALFVVVLLFSGGVVVANDHENAGLHEHILNRLIDTNDNAGLPEAGGGDDDDVLVRVIANIVNVFLGLLGLIAVCFVVYAGFMWMTAAGNEEQVKSAKSILINALIGVVIIIAAYIISAFVIKSILDSTTGGSSASATTTTQGSSGSSGSPGSPGSSGSPGSPGSPGSSGSPGSPPP